MPVNNNQTITKLLENASVDDLKILAGALSPYYNRAVNEGVFQVMFLNTDGRGVSGNLTSDPNRKLAEILSKYGLADVQNGKVIGIHKSLGEIKTITSSGIPVSVVVPNKSFINPFDEITTIATAKIGRQNWDNFYDRVNSANAATRIYILEAQEKQEDGTFKKVSIFGEIDINRTSTNRERARARAIALGVPGLPYSVGLRLLNGPDINEDAIKPISNTPLNILAASESITSINTNQSSISPEDLIASPQSVAGSILLSSQEFANADPTTLKNLEEGRLAKDHPLYKSLYYANAVSVKGSGFLISISGFASLPQPVIQRLTQINNLLKSSRATSNALASLITGTYKIGEGIVGIFNPILTQKDIENSKKSISDGLNYINGWLFTEAIKIPGITSIGNAIGGYYVSARYPFRGVEVTGPGAGKVPGTVDVRGRGIPFDPNGDRKINGQRLTGKKYTRYMEKLPDEWTSANKTGNLISTGFQTLWYLADYGPSINYYAQEFLDEQEINDAIENGVDEGLLRDSGGRIYLSPQVQDSTPYWLVSDPKNGDLVKVPVPRGIVAFTENTSPGDLKKVIGFGNEIPIEVFASPPTFWERATSVLVFFADAAQTIGRPVAWISEKATAPVQYLAKEFGKMTEEGMKYVAGLVSDLAGPYGVDEEKERKLNEKYEVQEKFFEGLSKSQQEAYLKKPENKGFRLWYFDKKTKQSRGLNPLDPFNIFGFLGGDKLLNSNVGLSIEVEVAKNEYEKTKNLLSKISIIADQYENGNSSVPNVALGDISGETSFALGIDGITEKPFESQIVGSLTYQEGCFSHDTLIMTKNGQIEISKIKLGDCVISFDKDGNLMEDIVSNTFVHDNMSIYRYCLSNGTYLDITENHPVLTEDGFFVPISQVSEIQSLIDYSNNRLKILSKKFIGIGTVYNIEVSKNHTYVANKIRVHNKTRTIPGKPVTTDLRSIVGNTESDLDQLQSDWFDFINENFPGALDGSRVSYNPDQPERRPIYTPSPPRRSRGPRRRGTPTAGPRAMDSTGFALNSVPSSNETNENYPYQNSQIAGVIVQLPGSILES